MIFKKLFAPTGETKELIAMENWSVRWYSRSGPFYTDTRKECEIFISKEDAEHFAEQLKAAFKLIKHTSGDSVIVEKS
jgi:hypothetical protein